MKKLPEQTLLALATKFGYAPDSLTKIGGGNESSDGIAYRGVRNGEPYVFKIVLASGDKDEARAKVQARAAFFAYLGKNGLDVVAPVENAAGNLIELETVSGDMFIAYTYRFMTGKHPEPGKWTDEMLHAWGRTIGTAHRLTKSYPVWERVIMPGSGKTLLSWRLEVESFREWCGDAEVKQYWSQIETRLDTLDQTRDTMGFIHNDPHMQNILFDGGTVKLLDFDVANCHFFACDLSIAMQSVLFTTGGGMDRPVSNQEAIDHFTNTLLEGYAKENTLSSDILGSLNTFIGYRRALLFTVMQDWLSQNKDANASWKRMVLEEPQVVRIG